MDNEIVLVNLHTYLAALERLADAAGTGPVIEGEHLSALLRPARELVEQLLAGVP
jgi:hypothetical protein